MSKWSDLLRERMFQEQEISIIKHGEGRIFKKGERRISYVPEPSGIFSMTENIAVKALRLDVVIGERARKRSASTKGYARGFAFLLSGLRANVKVGRHEHGPWTFVHGLLNGQTPTALNDEFPFMGHAVIGPLPLDVIVAPGEALRVEYTYDGPNTPIAFMRLMVLSIRTREIQ